MTDPILITKNLTKSFESRGNPCLSGIDLSFTKGQLISITGASGSGKSTLLHILGTLEMPTSGELYLLGYKAEPSAYRFLRSQIAFVFQSFHLLEYDTVIDNLYLPIYIANGKIDKELQLRADLLLDRLGLLDRKKSPVFELSGGEKKRIALIRALLRKEIPFLFADEPTSNLDAGFRKEVISLLVEQAEQGTLVITATHDEKLTEAAHYNKFLA